MLGWVMLCLFVADYALAENALPSREYRETYVKAMQVFGEGKYEEAMKLAREAVVLDPAQASAYNLLGATQVKLRQPQEAVASFQKILSLQPENSVAVFNLGEAYFLLKNYSEAKKYFESYLKTEGNATNALARYKMILCDLLGGREAAARETVLGLKPTISHPLEYYGRAALLFHQGDEEQARSYLESAGKIYSPGLNLAFADSLVELGWLNRNEVAEIGAVNAAALQSLSAEFQPQNDEDSSRGLNRDIESLLPALDEDNR